MTKMIDMMQRCVWAVVAVLVAVSSGCRDRSAGPSESGTARSGPATQPAVLAVLDFPAAVRCERAEVNAFIEDLVAVCDRGDYQAYRLMVTRRVEPIGEKQFRGGWQLIETIHIASVEAVAVGEGDSSPVYLVRGTVDLHPPREPRTRPVAMLIMQEDGQWVIAPRELGEQLRTSPGEGLLPMAD